MSSPRGEQRSGDLDCPTLAFDDGGALLSGSVADLLKYVQRLVSGSEDSSVFALTHTLFLPEAALLEALLGSLLVRSQDSTGEKVRARRVTNFLKTWLAMHNRRGNAELIAIINHYVERYRDVAELANDSRILKELVAQHAEPPLSVSLRKEAEQHLRCLADVDAQRQRQPQQQQVTDVDIQTLAVQLTFIEQTFFQRVDAEQLVLRLHSDSDEDEEKNTPLLQWQEHDEQVANWVRCEVTRNGGAQRCRVIERFVQLAAAMRDMGNFATPFQLVVALRSAGVQSLKEAWSQLDAGVQRLFAELSAWTSPVNDFHGYRALLSKKMTRPKLPYLRITLHDVDEAGRLPTFTAAGDVNWTKMTRLGRSLIELLQSQEVPFTFPFSRDLLLWIHASPLVTDDDQHDVADVDEPQSADASRSPASSGSRRRRLDTSRKPTASSLASSELSKDALMRDAERIKSSLKGKLAHCAALMQHVAVYLNADELERARAAAAQASVGGALALGAGSSLEDLVAAAGSVVALADAPPDEEVQCSTDEWLQATERATSLKKQLADVDHSLHAQLAERDHAASQQDDLEAQLSACLHALAEQTDAWPHFPDPDSDHFSRAEQTAKQLLSLLSDS